MNEGPELIFLTVVVLLPIALLSLTSNVATL
jgi:hypothetical protein